MNDWDAVPVKGQSKATGTSDWDAVPIIEPKKAATPEVSPVVGEQPSKTMSVLAGAGKAVGTGVLSLQQIIGKATTFGGDMADSDVVKQVGNWLQKDAVEGVKKLEGENQPYAQANPKSNLAGEIGGAVLSPVNKLIPMGGASASLTGAAAKGAAQGAAFSAATTPVVDEDSSFLTQKMKQAFGGALGGGIGGGIGHGLSFALNKGIDAVKGFGNRVKAGNPEEVAETVVAETLGKQGITAEALKAKAPELFDGLKTQVADAVRSGEKIDQRALTRLTQAQTLPVPVPMLKGQITRDPMQYALEQNLSGIHGVGEPLTNVLSAQNKALIANLNAMGAREHSGVVEGVKPVMDALVRIDKADREGVSAAYKAFENHTGKALDVPVVGLAQDYAEVQKRFRGKIPAAVESEFNALGLETGKQKKVFTIDDAEDLIKTINANYDPKNLAEAKALDALRRGVEKSIKEGAGSSAGGEAGKLAMAARAAAKKRFDAIDETPGLKAAINSDEPDKFFQKFIVNGNQAEIRNMMKVLNDRDPAAAKSLQDTTMGYIKSKVLNGRDGEEGSFSEAAMKNLLNDNSTARLAEVLGKEKMGQLRQLSEVATNARFKPDASGVNTSKTASAAANLVKAQTEGGLVNGVLSFGKSSKFPFVGPASEALQAKHQGTRLSDLITQAVDPSMGKKAAGTPLSLVVPFARGGSAAFSERSREGDRK